MAPTKKCIENEKLAWDKFDNLKVRLDALTSFAEKKLETISAPAASSTFNSILSLSQECSSAYETWLELASSITLPEEKISEVKIGFNNACVTADCILIELGTIAGIKGPLQADGDEVKTSSSRLPKVELRQFDKGNTRLWFDHLEVVFRTKNIEAENQRFAALLKFLDESTSSLLSSITRSEAKNQYSQAKRLLIKEFSLSKYDRVKAYVHEVSPMADERLTHFAARVDVLFEDITINDVRKFCLLRHAPAPVRLQLAGSRFEDLELQELLQEADTLTQRATQDAQLVAAFQPSAGKKKEGKKKGKRPRGPFKRVKGSSIDFPPSDSICCSVFNAGNFLIDSGSPLTIVPVPANDVGKPRSETGLLSASGEKIFSYGRKPIEIPINKSIYHYEASICNVVRPILGRDFFQGPGKDLLLDISQKKLVDRNSGSPVAKTPVHILQPDVVAAVEGSSSMDPTTPAFQSEGQLVPFRKLAEVAVKEFIEKIGSDDG
ncbi:Hypothetical predicted protein, partial [Paramuricea clavata]